MIDKNSDEWKTLPWWYRANMVGIKSRRSLLIMEAILLLVAFGFLPFGDVTRAVGFLMAAYVVGIFIRYGDSKNIG